MTSFEITRIPFSRQAVANWSLLDQRNANWPVVYVLDNASKAPGVSDVYVGESLNAAARMRQHLTAPDKKSLKTMRVIVDEEFNKSVCLDLESFLIKMLAGDGGFRVLNRNEGITDSDYYDRARYQDTFRDVFDELKDAGIFTRSIPEIENSDLFKLSPFKALTQDQAAAVADILDGLFEDLESGARSTIVIQGEPGTGKTVVAIYMLKLLRDIAEGVPADEPDSDSPFSEYFTPGHPELIRGLRIGFVVPQQSLRKSIQKVFRKTPGLSADMVMTPYQVGEDELGFDILFIDEAHRLSQRSNQASASLNTKFRQITEKLFGSNDVTKTQLDWIREKSRHQIYLLDAAQSVKPGDLSAETLGALVDAAEAQHRQFRLLTQMRVKAGSDYVGYVRRILTGDGATVEDFGEYDLRLFDSLAEMREAIRARDAESGLARLVAGYAWEWKTKVDKKAFDIELDGLQLRWNRTQVDWIASVGSLEEVGSIHTVQGYDLNYAGVIIGADLGYDRVAGRLYVDRDSYFDKKGKENNPTLGKTYTDDDLLRFVRNIYAVLLTRGIMGTYVYVCDPGLREYLKQFIPSSSNPPPASQ